MGEILHAHWIAGDEEYGLDDRAQFLHANTSAESIIFIIEKPSPLVKRAS